MMIEVCAAMAGCVIFVIGGPQSPGETTAEQGRDADGYALLIDAIRYSGANEDVVQSGHFKVSRAEVRPRPSEAEYSNEFQAYVEGLKARWEEVDAENKVLIEEALENSAESFEGRIRRRMNSVEQLRIAFEGVTPFLRVAVEHHAVDEAGNLGDRAIRISGTVNRNLPNQEKQYATHYVERHPGDIDIESNAYAEELPNEFGRFRGRTSLMLNAFLLDESDIASGRLDEEKIRVGHALNQSVLRESNGERGVRIVGRDEVEGSTCLVVETDDPGVTNLRGWLSKIKFWIDPGRGFITPRIIEYMDGQPAVEYVSSDYQYLEDAGLWWPGIHEVINHTEETVVRYEIDLDQSCVNCPIAEEEFELAIEPGNHVTDQRGGGSDVLVVQKPFQMKFERDGRLNFDSVKDIARPETPPGIPVLGVLSRQSGTSWIVIVNVVGIGLVVLVFGFRKWRRRGI